MLILLSPSKTMDQAPSDSIYEKTEPLFGDMANHLVKKLKKYSIKELCEILNISFDIAQQTFYKYQIFNTNSSPENSRQAIFSFKGDVYTSLNSQAFTTDEIEFAQKHVRILSGLYGYLRPMDQIQPYRLEMSTKLRVDRHSNLYHYWKSSINNAVKADLTTQKTDILVNLASHEYFKIIDTKSIDYKVITPVFLDDVNGKLKVVSIFAKKARGRMTAFIVKNKLSNPEHLNAFFEDGYLYNVRLSSPLIPVFTRG